MCQDPLVSPVGIAHTNSRRLSEPRYTLKISYYWNVRSQTGPEVFTRHGLSDLITVRESGALVIYSFSASTRWCDWLSIVITDYRRAPLQSRVSRGRGPRAVYHAYWNNYLQAAIGNGCTIAVIETLTPNRSALVYRTLLDALMAGQARLALDPRPFTEDRSSLLLKIKCLKIITVHLKKKQITARRKIKIKTHKSNPTLL